MATKTARKTTAKTPATPRKRAERRSPFEVVTELKERRERLASTYQDRLNRLDEKIAKLENRHAKRLAIAELLNSKTPEEIAAELESIKQQQQILKKALKTVSV